MSERRSGGGLEQLQLERDQVELIVDKKGINLLGFPLKPAVISLVYEGAVRKQEIPHPAVEESPKTNDALHINISPEGVFLSRDGSVETEISEEDVRNFLFSNNIFSAQNDAIAEFLGRPADELTNVLQPEQFSISECGFSVTMSDDWMLASIFKYDDAQVDAEELRNKLSEIGIVNEIKENEIEKICSEGLNDQFILIAEGKPHLDEKVDAGEFEVEFQEVRPKNSADQESSDLPIFRIAPVTKDQIIAKRGKKHPGEPGHKINGEIIPFEKVDWHRVHEGDNTYSRAAGPEIYSSIDGYVIYSDDGRLDVTNLLLLDEDIESGREAVIFDGKIITTGNVSAGIIIEAADDIIILGSAEEDALLKSGGEVIIYDGKKRKQPSAGVEEVEPEPVEAGATVETEEIGEEAAQADVDEAVPDEENVRALVEEMEKQTISLAKNSAITEKLKHNKKLFLKVKKDQEELTKARDGIQDVAPEVERLRAMKRDGKDLTGEQRNMLDEYMAKLTELMILEEEKKGELLNIGLDDSAAGGSKGETVEEEKVKKVLEEMEKSSVSAASTDEVVEKLKNNKELRKEIKRDHDQLAQARERITDLAPEMDKLQKMQSEGVELTPEQRAVLDEHAAKLTELMMMEEEKKNKLLNIGKD